jgi:hypothetical protein
MKQRRNAATSVPARTSVCGDVGVNRAQLHISSLKVQECTVDPTLPPTRISAGADGLTRVLWTSPGGTATLWLLGLDNVFQSSFGLKLKSF